MSMYSKKNIFIDEFWKRSGFLKNILTYAHNGTIFLDLSLIFWLTLLILGYKVSVIHAIVATQEGELSAICWAIMVIISWRPT
jgi:hypothetical protein